MADQVLMPNQTTHEMDFERILGVPFFIVVLTPSCYGRVNKLGFVLYLKSLGYTCV